MAFPSFQVLLPVKSSHAVSPSCGRTLAASSLTSRLTTMNLYDVSASRELRSMTQGPVFFQNIYL